MNFAATDALLVLLLVLVVLLALQLRRWHRDDTRFDLRDLLTDKGSQRVSLSKFGQFMALLVSTWALVFEVTAGRLSEWLFTAYMLAWAGAQVASLAFKATGRLDPKGGQQQ